MREGTERLLEVPHGLTVGRPRHGFSPRLPTVRQSLIPHLASQGMVGQPLDLLGQVVGIQRCHGVRDVRMQDASSLLEQTAIGGFMREGVLEGVFQLGEEAGLVEELRGLQAGTGCWCRVASGTSAMACRSAAGTSLPMTAADWRRFLSSGDSRSMRAASTACTVAGTCNVVTSCARR